MKRCLFVLAIIALPAQAIEWPWQERSTANYRFCKGFVSAGLGEFPVERLSRTKLWLSWNHVNRAELPEGTITPAQLQEGEERFDTLLSSGDLDALLQIANSDCDFVN